MEPLQLVTEAEVVGLGPIVAPPGATPWRNLIWRRPDGKRGVALAGQENWGDALESLKCLVGKVIKLRPGPNGLKVPGLALQPLEVVEAVEAVVVEPELPLTTSTAPEASSALGDCQLDRMSALASRIAEESRRTGTIGIFCAFLPADQ